jgi:hypothetical protein
MSPEAAPAIAKYDDDLKKLKDEKKPPSRRGLCPAHDIRLTRAP